MAVITDIWIQQTTASQHNLAGLKLALQITCGGEDKPKALFFPIPTGKTSIYHANATKLGLDDDEIQSIAMAVIAAKPNQPLSDFCWLPASIWISSLNQQGKYQVLSGNPNWQSAYAFTQQKLSHPLTLVPATAPLSAMTLQFSGVNDTVFGQGDSGLSFNLSQPFTIEFSLKESVARHGSLMVIQFNADGQASYDVWLEATGQISFAKQMNSAISLPQPSSPSESLNYLAVTYGDNNLDIYVNGKLMITPKISNWQAGKPLLLGAWVKNSALTDFFVGLIQEVRIWDVVRTSEQIQANLNQRQAGIGGNLVGYWWFSKGMLNGNLNIDSSPEEPDLDRENSESSPSSVKRMFTAEQSLGPSLGDYIN